MAVSIELHLHLAFEASGMTCDFIPCAALELSSDRLGKNLTHVIGIFHMSLGVQIIYSNRI
jgi:hypothetical protein